MPSGPVYRRTIPNSWEMICLFGHGTRWKWTVSLAAKRVAPIKFFFPMAAICAGTFAYCPYENIPKYLPCWSDGQTGFGDSLTIRRQFDFFLRLLLSMRDLSLAAPSLERAWPAASSIYFLTRIFLGSDYCPLHITRTVSCKVKNGTETYTKMVPRPCARRWPANTNNQVNCGMEPR